MAGESIPLIVKRTERVRQRSMATRVTRFMAEAVNAQAQASVLEMYDPERLTGSIAQRRRSELRVADAIKGISKAMVAAEGAGYAILTRQVIIAYPPRLLDKIKAQCPEA